MPSRKRGTRENDVRALAARVVSRAVAARVLPVGILAEYGAPLEELDPSDPNLNVRLLDRLAYDLLQPTMGQENAPVDAFQAMGNVFAELAAALRHFEEIAVSKKPTPQTVLVRETKDDGSTLEYPLTVQTERNGKLLRYSTELHSVPLGLEHNAADGRPAEALKRALMWHLAQGGLTMKEIAYFSGETPNKEADGKERVRWHLRQFDSTSLWESGEPQRMGKGKPRSDRWDLLKDGFPPQKASG